jgi:hypothetical protein
MELAEVTPTSTAVSDRRSTGSAGRVSATRPAATGARQGHYSGESMRNTEMPSSEYPRCRPRADDKRAAVVEHYPQR